MTTRLADIPIPEVILSVWSDAVEADDLYCKRKVDWTETRDKWRQAHKVCEGAGPAFEEMRNIAKNAARFYEDHKERALSIPLYTRYRKPWRTRF